MDYDPLLAKLIGFGADRDQAIMRLQRALYEYFVAGIKTNISLSGASCATRTSAPVNSTPDIWIVCWQGLIPKLPPERPSRALRRLRLECSPCSIHLRRMPGPRALRRRQVPRTGKREGARKRSAKELWSTK